MSARDQRYERDDVCGADARVRAFVAAQVDALARAGDAGDERLRQPGPVPDEREDGPVVVGIGMDVEDPRSAG